MKEGATLALSPTRPSPPARHTFCLICRDNMSFALISPRWGRLSASKSHKRRQCRVKERQCPVLSKMAVFHEVMVVFDGESEERKVNERAICVPVGASMTVGEKYAVKWRGGSTWEATIVRIIEHEMPRMPVSYRAFCALLLARTLPANLRCA